MKEDWQFRQLPREHLREAFWISPAVASDWSAPGRLPQKGDRMSFGARFPYSAVPTNDAPRGRQPWSVRRF